MANKSFKVLIYPKAEKDLFEIKSYYKNQLNISPNNLFEKFHSFIDILEQNPYAFPVVKDSYLSRRGYRMIPVDNYLVFYIVKDVEIQIHRFVYGKRNFRLLF